MGLPRFSLIGLGDSAVKESRERVLAALSTLEVPLPDQILINLSPAEEKKSGASLDVGIAVAVAASAAIIPSERLHDLGFIGELSLSGQIRPVRGAAAHAARLKTNGTNRIICAPENVAEIELIDGLVGVGFSCLIPLMQWLRGEDSGDEPFAHKAGALETALAKKSSNVTFGDIIGQDQAKRALMIAACGAHHILLSGPPGCGKTMLAKAFVNLLSPLNSEEILEIVTIHSVAGLPIENLVAGERPFRSPHHTISESGLVGGGGKVKPGEVSLAHNGVLFLDELPEFSRCAIEALRIPLEAREITVSRALSSVKLPANFLLVAAMNPCPCGGAENSNKRCRCSLFANRKIPKEAVWTDPRSYRHDGFSAASGCRGHFENEPRCPERGSFINRVDPCIHGRRDRSVALDFDDGRNSFAIYHRIGSRNAAESKRQKRKNFRQRLNEITSYFSDNRFNELQKDDRCRNRCRSVLVSNTLDPIGLFLGLRTFNADT